MICTSWFVTKEEFYQNHFILSTHLFFFSFALKTTTDTNFDQIATTNGYKGRVDTTLHRFLIPYLNKKICAASRQNQQSECAPSEDSDQPRHPPSLIRVFAVRMKKAWVLSYLLSSQRRLWSDWADGRTATLLVLSRGGSFSVDWIWPLVWGRYRIFGGYFVLNGGYINIFST